MSRWTIRTADASDTAALHRLAALDSQRDLRGPALIAELDSRPMAALELASGRVVADPFSPTAPLAAALRVAA